MTTYLPMLPIRNSSRLIGTADRPQSLIQRRFGHQAALIAGIERSRVDAVIMLDSDLQHPLELITRLVACWEEGAAISSCGAAVRETAESCHCRNQHRSKTWALVRGR